MHKQGGNGPIVIRLPKLADSGILKKVFDLSELYFEQMRLQSITSEFTQLMFGQISLVKRETICRNDALHVVEI